MSINPFGRRFLLNALLVVVACNVASAATINVTLGGQECVPGGGHGLCTTNTLATTLNFDGLTGTLLPYSEPGIATYGTSGGASPFTTGSVSGEFAAPDGDSTTYLTVGSPRRPSEITISLPNPINYFGFYLGSPDAYNRIAFYSGGSLVQGFQGNDLIDPANGDWATGEYVNFQIMGGTVDQIVLSSPSAAFETDNHAFVAPVPEPFSIGLVGTGLLSLASVARRRRSKAA